MLDLNYLFGAIGNALRVLLLLPLFDWKNAFTGFNRSWLLKAPLLSLSLAMFLSLVLPGLARPADLSSIILFTVILAPILEEFIYRGILLRGFLSGDYARLAYVGIVLTLPDVFFYYRGWTTDKPVYGVIVLIGIFVVARLGVEKFVPVDYIGRAQVLAYTAVVFQAAIFAVMHASAAAQSQIYMGLLYGWIYYKSRSIVPSILAHATSNMYVAVVGWVV